MSLTTEFHIYKDLRYLDEDVYSEFSSPKIDFNLSNF